MTDPFTNMRFLNMSYTLRAAELFDCGKRTDQIAKAMKVPEAAVANSLSRLREMQREEGRAA